MLSQVVSTLESDWANAAGTFPFFLVDSDSLRILQIISRCPKTNVTESDTFCYHECTFQRYMFIRWTHGSGNIPRAMPRRGLPRSPTLGAHFETFLFVSQRKRETFREILRTAPRAVLVHRALVLSAIVLQPGQRTATNSRLIIRDSYRPVCITGSQRLANSFVSMVRDFVLAVYWKRW